MSELDGGESRKNRGGERPILLTILSAIYISWGFFIGYTLYQRIYLDIPLPGVVEVDESLISGLTYGVLDIIILIGIAILMFTSGIGLIKLRKWGYYSALSLAFIGGVVSTIYFPISIIGIIINLGIIWYLTRDNIKSLFT